MRTIIVTGVAGSLGSALSAHFLARGDLVLGLDLCEPPPPGEGGERLVFERCDLRDPAGVESTIAGLVADHGPMDVVINGAGLIVNAPLLQLEDGALVKHDLTLWREVIDATLNSAFYVSACCAQAMVSRARRGVIVNVSSICATGNLGQPAYSAAKAGLNGLTASLAKELAPLGVRVAAVAPGYLDSESTRREVPQEALDAIRKRTPTRRLGDVAQFLAAIDFVIDTPDFNGKVLELDGGLTL